MPLSSCVCTGRHTQVNLQDFVVLCVVMAQSPQERHFHPSFSVSCHSFMIASSPSWETSTNVQDQKCQSASGWTVPRKQPRLRGCLSLPVQTSHTSSTQGNISASNPYPSPLCLVGCFLISCWFTSPFVSLYFPPLFASYIHLPDACVILFWLPTFALYISNPF